MQSAPPGRIELARFGVWRGAVTAVAAAALAALAGWSATALEAASAPGRVGALLAALGVGAVAWSLLRVPAGRLGWNGGVWRFEPVRRRAPAREGSIGVALDLGAFLLLVLRDGRRRPLWLPVQRAGLERDWHALRTAVHAPAGGDASAA